MMHEKFQMSSIVELTFFLGLQVKQKQDGIFISQDKYLAEILEKYGFTQVKNANTPMKTQKPLLKDKDGKEVDVHMYRSLIGSLMYLTSSRLDIMFAVCACARYQVNLKVSHLHAVKRIFRQFWTTAKVKTINGEGHLQALVDGKKILITESTVGRDLQLEHAEAVDCLPNAAIFEQLTLIGIYVTPAYTKKIFRNMRRVGKGFSGRETPLFSTMMVQAQEEMGKGLANPTDPHHPPIIIQPSTPQQKQRPRKTKRKDTKLPQTSGPTANVADKAVNKEMDDSLVRAATTASSLEAEQESGNINKTQSKATLNESSPQGTDSGGGPRCQEIIGDTIAQTRIESYDDDKDLGKDASKQGRISDNDADEGITLVSTHDDAEMFDADQDLGGEEVFVAKQDGTELVEESSKKLKSEVMKGSFKRARTELEQESSKKQKIDDEIDTTKLK
nr:uncharacterized mitochondrial protein AtMg00810-like [Tanacetum cinerariifolium]